ncbi:MAG: bifunctional glycosyltransferase family 2/GtrA family protein [Acidobacteria bacterium]|nr:bifunctional glycosyltransferase family 2/GtrA family protein [Acidobacteriota bacterium]
MEQTPGVLTLLIPAYQPARGLASLVDEVLSGDREGLFRQVIVVDDGSGPEHAPVFDSVRSSGAVTVLRHAVNLGKGAALKTGLNHALVAWPGALGVVTADADGQHTAGDILRVAAALRDNPERVVLGVRRFDGPVPARSKAGNAVTRAVFRAVTGMALADTQTGLRGWPRAYCAECLRILVNGFDFELECLLMARSGPGPWRVPVEVEIRTVYQDGNRGSHFNPLLDSMRVYFVFLRYCASGALAAVADSLTFVVTHELYGSVALSQVCGRAAGVAVVFTLLRRFVFRYQESLAASLAKYLLLVAVMGFVSYGLIRSLAEGLGLPVLAAKLLAEGVLFLGNFAIQREFVFAKR